MRDLVIIGGGAAGLSAAIYGARAGLSVLVLEGGLPGGQIINAPGVENYPGLPHISGYDFIQLLRGQASAMGAGFSRETASGLAPAGGGFTVAGESGDIDCRAVVIAAGAHNRPLGLPDERRLAGSGVSYCATCDGAFFREREVAVVGGGSTAVEDALFLSAYCQKVWLIHRRAEFRAARPLLDSLRAKDNVEFLLDSTVEALGGGTALEYITVRDTGAGQTRRLDVAGLFVAIGQDPNNAPFAPLIALDDYGYIIAGEDCRTNLPGVFAAGDGRAKPVRQLVTAAADGAVAALAAAAYVRQL